MVHMRIVFRWLILVWVAGFSLMACQSNQPIKPLLPNTAQAITYQPSDEVFYNPERGWAQSINITGSDLTEAPLTVERLNALRNAPEHFSLVRKYYQLRPFMGGDISAAFLENLQKDFDAVRRAGLKLVPRFVYVWNLATNKSDADTATALKHLEQLKPVLQNNEDVLAMLEAGMVGYWGEWHSSSSQHVDNYTLEPKASALQIRDKLLEITPSSRFVAMRYLSWHKYRYWPEPLSDQTAFRDTVQARVAHHNDMVVEDANWMVTGRGCGGCPSFETLQQYAQQDTRRVPQTGEPTDNANDLFPTTGDPRPGLSQMHYSMLIRNANTDENATHYQHWITQGYFPDITRQLGYRLQLVRSELPNWARAGETLTGSATIKNVGWAAPYNPRGLELILRHKTTQAVQRLSLLKPLEASLDPRFWLPESGEIKFDISVQLPASLELGQYELLLNLPDPKPTLYERPDYAIRLANQGVWEAATGFNRLGATLEIGQ
jgi:Domain of unknown function (DUF4832)/Domain of unknown function (DUF4874)